MKIFLVVLTVACVAKASEIIQKRSISGDLLGGYYGDSYGLSSASLLAPSISTVSLGAPSISSHTHTHSTAFVDRPVPVAIPSPTITTTSILPSYNYGLSSSPYNFGSYPSSSFGSYPSTASYSSYPSTASYGSYGSLGFGYPSFNKYYAPRSYPATTIYKKSYSYPSLKYKW